MWAGLIFREEIAVLPGSHRRVQQQNCATGSLAFNEGDELGLSAGSNTVVKLSGGRVKLRWYCLEGN